MIVSVLGLRMRLLLRQKLGWTALLVGCALIFLSYVVANASFINPLKIFWDFSLGASFFIQSLLAIYLSSQLFADESAKRTLHLLLSGGLSRISWLIGNALGIFCWLTLMNFLWLGFSLVVSKIFMDEWGPVTILFQSQWLLMIEILTVIFLTFLLSFIARSLVALMASFSVVAFLHSLESLQRIFTDPESGRQVDDYGLRFVLWFARLLPPLEWLDLKSFVGYRDAFEWSFIGQMTLIGLLWVFILATLSMLRLNRMDL